MFDPENHQANLVWRNGEIIDMDEEETMRNAADIEEAEPIDKDIIATV